VTRDSAADSIVEQALQPFDYTKVINAAYADGVRLFVEMGPGNSCTRMIDRILEDRPHLARAVCVKRQDNVSNMLHLIAQLHAEHVTVNPDCCFPLSAASNRSAQGGPQLSVATGGKPFRLPAMPVHRQSVAGSEPLKKASRVPTPLKSQARMPDVGVPVARQHPVPVQTSLSQLDPAMNMTALIEQMQQTELARAEAQEVFLRVSNGMSETIGQALSMQMNLLQANPGLAASLAQTPMSVPPASAATEIPDRPVVFDRAACMQIAIGSLAEVLGPEFAEVDSYPTRVRLPDEPLMLVDRIVALEGEARSMGSGRVVTEHDVLPGAWYLDGGRIPTCIAVEAGQADLFLSGYLGIDHITKGQAVYRLLDAKITFHDELPRPGQTIQYDIRIDQFFRQDNTWLFRFNFEGSVDGRPVLTMTEGCAGFFTQAELDAGKGIVQTALEKRPLPGKRAADWQELVPMQAASYTDVQLDALRQGDLASCFGEAFRGLPLHRPVGLPAGRMTLVHRILELQPEAGRFGLGQITGEADIHPDDWFLTCHFSDDQVMPGTLMYECCLHTLRVYLLRMGWVGEQDQVVYEPIPGEISQLKCRGQVLATTRKVQYRITLKEIGYRGDQQTPYVLADALMFADGRAIVQMNNMSVQLSGLSRSGIAACWQQAVSEPVAETARPVLFDFDSIYAFARGKPSDAFGDRYKVFDEQRVIARLPGPPYQFLDRITLIEDCQPWVLKAGGVIEGEYDVPADAWYFASDRQPRMPFAILLEIALQPCGWLAGYLGSALTSEQDLSFRNLGGKGSQLLPVTAATGTLTTRIKITSVSQSGGMIIQNFDMETRCSAGVVYRGDTYFGFFSKQALADQVGIREVTPYQPTTQELQRGRAFEYPDHAPYPQAMMRMVDRIELIDAEGGPQGLGFIRGTARVKPDAWFFKAHFYQDPVWPGSLGLESFMQLLKVFACERWQNEIDPAQAEFQSLGLNQPHNWVYRGQILPSDTEVTVQAVITAIDDQEKQLHADGFLTVDGRIIYQMNNFTLTMHG
jgi:3-hydroxymyristoyl/3-hydroxydecanoyl-(acyl carrier protein) dehydratase